jgi:hypothetical protein
MERACGTYGGEEKCIQGFGKNTWKKKTAWKTGVDGMAILKLILTL